MPFPPASRALGGPRRRSLLVSAAGAALLVGCSAGTDESGGAGGSPSPADRVRARAARDSQGLVQRYDAVLAAHPALTRRLWPLRAEVARHVTAFGGTEPDHASPSPSTPPAGTPTADTAPATDTATTAAAAAAGAAGPEGLSPAAGSSAPSSPAVPGNEKDALAGLAAAERSLADRRAAELLQVPGELARLLASVAAAGAAHVYLLSEGAK